ncbi:hypothetical protein T03_16895 [Trichinella britovi]|uniref:Uncharacterized protein n=1 Tax=Trichinella britovi TaxID=45882 RepID=A0A0V1CJE3_TRIBR|nr:hypothetical protein T03_16895 [Trichinella britovi]
MELGKIILRLNYGNVILIKNTYMDCQITDMKVTKQRRLDLIVEYIIRAIERILQHQQSVQCHTLAKQNALHALQIERQEQSVPLN